MWKSIFVETPLNDQFVWIRVQWFYGYPVTAIYNSTTQEFYCVETGIVVPAYVIGRWQSIVDTALTTRTKAYIIAAFISDATTVTAINTFDTDIISNSLETVFQAIYLMIGGTEESCKWNFMDCQDTNAAFRLSFQGGWTFASTGATPNGTTAHAHTHYTPSNDGGLDNQHIAFYSRTSNTTSATDIGCSNSSYLKLSCYDATYYRAWMNDAGGTNILASATTLGLFMAKRSLSNLKRLYVNGTLVNSSNQVSTSLPAYQIYLGALNNADTAQEFSDREYAFASIGINITNAEASTFYTILQTLQTSLGRQV